MSQLPKKREPQTCPEENLWLKLAANVLDKRDAKKLLQHASKCNECSQRLKTLMQYRSLGATEAIDLEKLTPEWQDELAGRMADQFRPSPKRSHPLTWTAWRLGVVTSILVTAIFAVFLIFTRKEHPEIESLLARAYSEHRTLEARIPRAPYSQLTVTKGGTEGSLKVLAKPAAAITSLCENKGDNPKCLLYEARLNLLDWQYKSALAALARIDSTAQLSQPEHTDFLINHALALFEKGQKEREVQPPAESYKTAVEDLSEVLASDSNNNVALFNRALIYEELQMLESARADWRRLIAVEKDSGWKNEAQRHLDAIEGKKKSRESKLKYLNEEPETYQEISSTRKVDPLNSEWLLVVATKEWLSSRRFQLALQRLASALETDHHERWLSDFLNSSRPIQAISNLQSAISSSATGRWESAEHDARAAEKIFFHSGNLPGAARSQLEIVYSLHRQSKAEECLKESSRLASSIKSRRYPWIETQNLIETSICQEMKNNFQLAERTIGQALVSAQDSSYLRLHLRALGMQASFDKDQGRWTQAWTRDEAGLQAFWQGEIYSPEQGQQFYSELAFLATATGQRRLAFALHQETVAILEQSKHVDLQAYAHFDLGTAAEEVADHETAMNEFHAAYELFHHLPQDTTTRIFEDAATISLAETEIKQGKIPSAQDRLNKIHLSQDRQNFTFALPYWRALADIEKIHGNPGREEEYLAQAMSIGNRGFGNLNLERDRWEWRKTVRPAYLRLLELETSRPHDATQALADWELFRNAEIEGRFPKNLTHDLRVRQRLLKQTKNLRTSTLISFVPFADSFVAWIADDRGVQEFHLDISRSRLEHDVQIFLRLCSDRESPLTLLQDRGATIYAHLFAPLAQMLDPERTLLIEGDAFLSRIPWPAIVLPTGEYFGQIYKSISTPGLLYQSKHRLPKTDSAPVRGLVVAPGALSFHDEAFLPLPQVDDEVQMISALYPGSKCIRDHQATVSKIRRELPQSSFLHFSGHALTRESGGELLLWGAKSGDALSAASLSKFDLHRCQLVVLSACSSAEVEQEIDRNPNGLVRSFLAAGARTVVASRWEIDFEATTALMRNFYHSLHKGETAAAALKDAQQQLLQQPTSVHPYFWAAFEVFGAPDQ